MNEFMEEWAMMVVADNSIRTLFQNKLVFYKYILEQITLKLENL